MDSILVFHSTKNIQNSIFISAFEWQNQDDGHHFLSGIWMVTVIFIRKIKSIYLQKNHTLIRFVHFNTSKLTLIRNVVKWQELKWFPRTPTSDFWQNIPTNSCFFLASSIWSQTYSHAREQIHLREKCTYSHILTPWL